MRVKLRIARAGCAVAERRGHEAFAANADAAGGPAARHCGLPLEIAERVAHGCLMGEPDRPPQRLVSDSEQHAHALRRRERDVESGNPCASMPAERLAGPGIA